MTRKEWMEKNLPAYIDDCSDGGVISCPRSYNELVRIDPSVLTNEPCEGCREVTPFVCEKCWNMELNVKEERSKSMTRREFVIQNYGKEVANDAIPCGIHGCPGHYPKLVALDPSCNALCVGQPSCKDNGLTCMGCWEVNVKEERKETTALCDRCNCAPICSIKCDYHQTLADLTSLKKKNPAFTITCDCEYFTPASCEKGE